MDATTESCSNPVPAKAEETIQNLVQIKADSEEEVRRRIDAFIQNKRNEVDERNIREFISPFNTDTGSSCARVEAVYVHREGQKSHISLKHVENLSGPQTRQPANDCSRPPNARIPLDIERREAVEERLVNMETHLNLAAGNEDIYKRLKNLEERIIFLEGLSPEYFANGIPYPKSVSTFQSKCDQEDKRVLPSSSSHLQNESLPKIDKRIEQLKQILKAKSRREFLTDPGTT